VRSPPPLEILEPPLQCERRYSYADYWGHFKGVWILFDE
jgi:hypothetical protein